MSEKMSDAQLIEYLTVQNDFLADSTIDVIKIVSDVKDGKMYNAIIQTDYDTFANLMKVKKVSVNWDKCHVKEHYSIMRCHKCCGFDHTKETCTNNVTCGYCNGNHLSIECEENTLECVNCVSANVKFNLSLDTKHHSWSRKCETLTRKIKKVAEKTDYSENK